MIYKKIQVRLFIFVILVLLLAACASVEAPPSTDPGQTQIQPTQTIARVSDSEATLVAASPSLEVTFDGKKCEVRAGNELNTGEHVFLLHNQSGQRTSLVTGRLYPETRWEDYLQWREATCGPPGSICPVNYGGNPFPGVAWLFEVMSNKERSGDRYYKYDLNVQGTYLLQVYWLDGNGWPCGTYQVGASP